MLTFNDDLFEEEDDGNSPFEGTGGYNGLIDPYLGPMDVTNVQIAEINNKQNLETVFTATDEEHKGQTHSHIIWEPEPAHPKFNEASFKKNMSKFLVHLLYRFSNEETDEDRQLWARQQIMADDWLSLCRQVIAAMESVNYKEKHDLLVKIPGSAYGQAKPRLRIPPWPFTTDDRSAGVLKWSTNDIKENNKYLAAINMPKDAPRPISNDLADSTAIAALEALDETM